MSNHRIYTAKIHPNRLNHKTLKNSDRGKRKRNLAELEGVLFAGELEIAADEDKHTAVDAGGLAIDGGDAVLALLKGEASELVNDVLSALDLLTLEG